MSITRGEMLGLLDTSVHTPHSVTRWCTQGLAVLGYRVMETVGREITEINFSRGFAVELGSTLSVVLASVVGRSSCHLLPLS